MRRLILPLLTLLVTVPAQSQPAPSQVDIYTAGELHTMGDKLAQKGNQFASQDLARYANHYTMLAERGQTGSSELHQHESDVFIVESGEATIVTGGKIVNPHMQKPGEIRGTSIQGGERHHLAVGDIINLPAGTPHQLLLDKGKPFTYFVVKVKGE